MVEDNIDKAVKEYESLVQIFARYSEDSFRRGSQLNEKDFTELWPAFARFRGVFDSAGNLQLHFCSQYSLLALITAGERVRKVFARVSTFDPQKNSDLNHFEDILIESYGVLSQARSDSAEAIARMRVEAEAALPETRAVPHLDYLELMERFAAIEQLDLTSIHGRLVDAVVNAKSSATRADQIANQIALSSNAKTFADKAQENKRISHWCLGISVLFALLLVVAGKSIQIARIDPGADLSTKISAIASGLALPIFLLFVVIVGVRLFASERHNHVINLQRAMAIDTFDKFVGSTKDEAVRNAILLQAATAAFSHQPTGYNKAPIDGISVPMTPIGAAKDISS